MTEPITHDLALRAIAAARRIHEQAEPADLWPSRLLHEEARLWSGTFGALLDLLELMYRANHPLVCQDALSALISTLDKVDPGWRER